MMHLRAIYTGVAGSPWYLNTYWGGGSQAEAQTAADALRTFLGIQASRTRQGITIQVQTTVQGVNPVDGNLEDAWTVTSAALTGGDSGDMLPPANQILLNVLTPVFRRGRSVRGRMFLPGFTESASSATGVPGGAAVLGIPADAAPMLLGAGTGIGVWSRPSAAGPGAFTEATGFSLSPKFGVLRSRRD